MTAPYRQPGEVNQILPPGEPDERAVHRGIYLRSRRDGSTVFLVTGFAPQRLLVPTGLVLVADLVVGRCVDGVSPMPTVVCVSLGFVAVVAAYLWVRSLERILITPLAFVRHRLFRRDRHLVADVRAIVVSHRAVEVHLPSERLQVAAGRDEASLRWLARRLRQVVERAKVGASIVSS
jgi:hypothetical protein